MKRVVSILILLILLFFIFEWGITFFKKGHEITYKVYNEDLAFDIVEVYQKDNGDSYEIFIENEDNTFYYAIANKYNKQKKIIKNIEYFNENDNICIYPILEDGSGTYIECVKDKKVYTSDTFYDQNFIFNIKKILKEKGYEIYKESDTTNIKKHSNSTIYINNILTDDIVTLWNYKGIDIINNLETKTTNALNFDKYENNHSYLVGEYYIVPNYLSSRVLEFSSVTIINLDDGKIKKLDLEYTLSSDTYINGVVDGKLYYTDPSNLLQIEVNPIKNNVRLIGSKDLGGQLYNGNWENANIYDFVNNKISFSKKVTDINYSYVKLIEGDFSYYFYNNNGEIYQVSKNDITKSVLLLKVNGINNFNVVDDTIYYVSGDTLYYFNNKDGVIPMLKNNELLYNTTNRINIYRKS